MNKEQIEIDIDHVVIAGRFRKDNGDLSALEASIRNLGLLFPIIVDSNNTLISGGRRLEACRRVGLKNIPALKLDVEFNNMACLDIQSDENLCRQPLTARELEELIRQKKSNMGERSMKQGLSIFSWFKKMVAPESAS